MAVLITGDIHITDSPRDAHRWGLLPWLGEQAKKREADAAFILGDLTDAKDQHPATLVNKFVEQVRALSDICPVYILKGNHDYIDEGTPFFGFLDSGDDENIHFIKKPELHSVKVTDHVQPCWFLPSTRDWQKDWADLNFMKADYVFTHQTYDGARVENGSLLPGIPPSFFQDFRGQVYSGDIHVPQKIGRNIEYIGAPYRCRFGDDYEPRVLFIPGRGSTVDLRFPCRSKHVVVIRFPEELEKQRIPSGDQVKVRVRMTRAELPNWQDYRLRIKDYAKEAGWELYGPELVPLATAAASAEAESARRQYRSPPQVLEGYAAAQKLGVDLTAIGLELLEPGK